MHLRAEAILLSVRAHGEHGAVVRLMTPDDGLQAAYVRGARGRRMRPVLVPGNLVQARLRSRTEEQLALMSKTDVAAAILDRVERLLAALGSPEKALPPVIHVAGTNGKGSTVAFLEAIARGPAA